MERVLYYVHDPMCSWCWAFRPMWERITRELPAEVAPRRLLGGLARDTDQPMPPEMRAKIETIWRKIQQRVPGTRFNFDFWERCQPRRATYPACRAVIAARDQGARFEEPMILSIQRAYYIEARNPSDRETLEQLAEDTGLDLTRFRDDLDAPETQVRLEAEIDAGRAMGVTGFPTLVLRQDGVVHRLHHDYRDHQVVLAQLETLIRT